MQIAASVKMGSKQPFAAPIVNVRFGQKASKHVCCVPCRVHPKLRHERNNDRRSKEKELAKVQRSIDRCLSFIIDGDGPMDAVREKLRQLELTKSTMEKSMEHDVQPNKIEMHPNIGQLYQRKISEISHVLSYQASREEAILLIRSLIERIDITPGEKRGQPQVQLIGGLAAILEFAVAKQQKTASPWVGGFVYFWLRVRT